MPLVYTSYSFDLILYKLSCHWSVPLAFIRFILVLNYVPFGPYLLLSLDFVLVLNYVPFGPYLLLSLDLSEF